MRDMHAFSSHVAVADLALRCDGDGSVTWAALDPSTTSSTLHNDPAPVICSPNTMPSGRGMVAATKVLPAGHRICSSTRTSAEPSLKPNVCVELRRGGGGNKSAERKAYRVGVCWGGRSHLPSEFLETRTHLQYPDRSTDDADTTRWDTLGARPRVDLRKGTSRLCGHGW